MDFSKILSVDVAETGEMIISGSTGPELRRRITINENSSVAVLGGVEDCCPSDDLMRKRIMENVFEVSCLCGYTYMVKLGLLRLLD